MSSFKTYVDITEHGSEDYEWVINEDEQPKLEPRLLPGEVVVASAPNVLKFASISNRKHGTSGWLFVTNFKLAFVSPTSSSYSGSSKDERNKILSPNELCLANIDHVFQVNGERKKRLLPGASIVTNVKTLQIVCKDFSVHSYSFKFCPASFHKTVVNAILHHSYPKRVELLFTFECTLPPTQNVHGMQFFSSPADWESEVERCHCREGWRVCKANDRFQLSASLPRGFVVPRSLSDGQILKASKHFMGNRPPIWCWGHLNQCVIVRMAVLHPFITDTQQESIMLENVRKSHPNLREPLILELDKSMPSPADIQVSWLKLRDSCCSPLDNIQKFWEQDSRFMSLLNGSRWPHYVMCCLRMASRVVVALSHHQVSVVLQESESRDTSAIISSLAQVIMDPHFRTINGFQSLVQKEWVSMGHAFTKRLGRIATGAELAGGDTSLSSSSGGQLPSGQQSPLFQLFLDCVWQLQDQFPSAFEFSQTYLTSLWDSLHNTVFDTFGFDSERVRHLLITTPAEELSHPQLTPRSVWDWSAQFHDIDVGLFLNPLFSITCRVAAYRQRHGVPVSSPGPSMSTIPPFHSTPASSTSTGSPPRWIPSTPIGGSERPRRNSISGTLPRGSGAAEYGAAGGQEGGGTDTLGRSWGSRFGLSGLTDLSSSWSSGAGGGSSRWKRIRGALFHGHSGRSFSPGSHHHHVIEEGMENPSPGEEVISGSSVVTYRASLQRLPSNENQRWTVHGGIGDHQKPAVYDPIPSCPIQLSANLHPPKLDLPWNSSVDAIPYHELDWPVYTTLPVADACADFRLWSQCYLRWIPVLDVRGGGEPPVYFHHCSLINDIHSLEAQLERLFLLQQGSSSGQHINMLQNGQDDVEDESTLAGQRYVTMSDHSSEMDGGGGQITLSCFHPFMQQQNDSALSFGEWEIVPSPVLASGHAQHQTSLAQNQSTTSAEDVSYE